MVQNYIYFVYVLFNAVVCLENLTLILQFGSKTTQLFADELPIQNFILDDKKGSAFDLKEYA